MVIADPYNTAAYKAGTILLIPSIFQYTLRVTSCVGPPNDQTSVKVCAFVGPRTEFTPYTIRRRSTGVAPRLDGSAVTFAGQIDEVDAIDLSDL